MMNQTKKAMPANGLQPQANMTHTDEQKNAVLAFDFSGTAQNAQESPTARLCDFGLPNPQNTPKSVCGTATTQITGMCECHEPDKQFDFLAYLRECHRHYRLITPQTAHSTAERRRYASIYRDMRAIEPAKASNPYSEVQR